MPFSAARKKQDQMPRHVIVVEDDAVLGMELEQALSDAGVELIDICPSAASTLEILRKRKPDAIIIDVHLADRDDGWGIAEMVDAIGGKPPRIIFQTGSPQDIPSDVAKLGPVLEKPYETSELVRHLRGSYRAGLLAALRRG